jgi:hypothetical protein
LLVDSLDAESAFFHDPGFAHGYIRVQLKGERLFPNRIVEVEETGIIGARIRAISGSNAPVVHLSVQTLFGVMTGVGGTDRLAWRMFALLAQDRPELDACIREFALPVPFNANPVYGTSTRRLLRAGRGDIVFGAARYNTGFAARRAIQIHCHSPSMWHLFILNGVGNRRNLDFV